MDNLEQIKLTQRQLRFFGRPFGDWLREQVNPKFLILTVESKFKFMIYTTFIAFFFKVIEL